MNSTNQPPAPQQHPGYLIFGYWRAVATPPPPPPHSDPVPDPERVERLRLFLPTLLSEEYGRSGHIPHEKRPDIITKEDWCYGVDLIRRCYMIFTSQNRTGEATITEWIETCNDDAELERYLFGPARALKLKKGPLITMLLDFIYCTSWRGLVLLQRMPSMREVCDYHGRRGVAERLSVHRTMFKTVIPPQYPHFDVNFRQRFDRRGAKWFSSIRAMEALADGGCVGQGCCRECGHVERGLDSFRNAALERGKRSKWDGLQGRRNAEKTVKWVRAERGSKERREGLKMVFEPLIEMALFGTPSGPRAKRG
jgi:hypothetical protein